MKRYLILTAEKGSSTWLNTLPIESLGYSFNKQEFHALRYGWKICGTSSHCSCSKLNNTDHALVCKLGGYTIMRHNEVRDAEAELLREVCRDVQVEPALIPLSGQQFSRSRHHSDLARFDISARGLWSPMEGFSILTLNPIGSSPCPSYMPAMKVKRRMPTTTVSFKWSMVLSPPSVSTSGGESPECRRYHQRLASLLSAKRKEEYAETMTYIRRKIRFCLLRTTLISIRGYRKPKAPPSARTPLSETDILVSEAAHRR